MSTSMCAASGKCASPFPDGSGHSAHDPYWATVTEVRELHTAVSDRSCVHVEIDISQNRYESWLPAPLTCACALVCSLPSSLDKTSECHSVVILITIAL